MHEDDGGVRHAYPVLLAIAVDSAEAGAVSQQTAAVFDGGFSMVFENALRYRTGEREDEAPREGRGETNWK